MTVFGTYLFLSFGACIMMIARIFFVGKAGFGFLIWNLFLAWIPFVVSLFMRYVYRFYKQSLFRTLLMIGLGIIWLFFYPNAPYMITDFMHLNRIKFYFAGQGYNMDFIVWYDLVMISLFILTGFLLGFVSLYIIQRLVVDRFNKAIGWGVVVCTMFLSSFGIYLGRFIRWNSWDIISNPFALLDSISESFHGHSFAFTVTFGLFLLLMYLAIYCLTHLNDAKVGLHREK